MRSSARAARRRRTAFTSKQGSFDPEDESRVKYTRLGVWDFYEERNPILESVPLSSKLEGLLQFKETLPYVWRMLIDIGSLRSCWLLLILYCLIDLLSSVLPATSIW